MNIVVLDGFTLNPGDLSWGLLEQYGRVTVYDRTPANSIVDRAKEADIVLTNKTPLRADTLKQLPKLRFISVLATGYDVVDIAEASSRGIIVSNVPGYSTMSVAQLTFALLLELCQQVGLHDRAVHEGEWANCADFSFWKTPLVELAGKTLGLVGTGSIGEQVARIGQAFGMNVIVTNRSGNPPAIQGVEWVPFDRLIRESDVVSLHCPLTPDTEGLINEAVLSQMKRTAYLVNTARGKLVHEQDLASALNEGLIAGAGLDVLSMEPPSPDHPLLHARNCIITPHLAWASREARQRLMGITVHNVQAFLAGTPTNVVSQVK